MSAPSHQAVDIMTRYTFSTSQAEDAQDYCFVSELDSGVIWGICSDAHGDASHNAFSLCTWVEDQDWKTIFSTFEISTPKAPGRVVEALIGRNIDETLGEGLCMLIFRVTNSRIDFWWRGDVVGRVYVDNALLISTTPHAVKNLVEARASDRVHPTWHLKVLNKHQITMQPSARLNINKNYGRPDLDPVNYNVEDCCAAYNCLGHKGWADGTWSYLTVPRRHTKRTTVICGSDGLWDMLSRVETSSLSEGEPDADSLTELAAARWRQDWEYIWSGLVHRLSQKIDSADDVSCAVVAIPAS